jgi:hypothetical protein
LGAVEGEERWEEGEDECKGDLMVIVGQCMLGVKRVKRVKLVQMEGVIVPGPAGARSSTPGGLVFVGRQR